MKKTLKDWFVEACAQAAIACEPWIGKGDKEAADAAAVEALRAVLSRAPMKGRVVIGEGERDAAPMLFIGEELGDGGPEIDIAVDPLEGTRLCAENQPGALCVAAFAPRGQLLHAPDVYMSKIAAGPGIRLEPHDLSRPFAEVLIRAAKDRGVDLSALRVVMLDRPRHELYREAVALSGAQLTLLPDGDVMGALQTSMVLKSEARTAFDLYVGSGGAPEGVLAAAGLVALGGSFNGRLMFRNDEEILRGRAAGLEDPSKIYALKDLAGPSACLVMAGVTSHVLKGVQARTPQSFDVDMLTVSKAGTEGFMHSTKKGTP